MSYNKPTKTLVFFNLYREQCPKVNIHLPPQSTFEANIVHIKKKLEDTLCSMYTSPAYHRRYLPLLNGTMTLLVMSTDQGSAYTPYPCALNQTKITTADLTEGTGIQNSRCTTPNFLWKECYPGAGVWSKSDYRTKTARGQIQYSFLGSRCTPKNFPGKFLLSSDPRSKQTEWSIHPRKK